MTSLAVRERIRGIDTVRGLIMIIMTLDHSRDFLHFQGPQYAPTNMATTTVILFFTRWITHFCAPTFVLLSGVSAWLAGRKRTKAELTGFLLKRGIWLILTDLLLISLLFTFDPKYHVFVLEVLWAIGCGMILLGLLIRLQAPTVLIGMIGCALVFGHNLLDYMNVPGKGLTGNLFTLLLTGRGAIVPVGGDRIIALLYAALPWSGVLLTGYMIGSLYATGFPADRRKRLLLIIGSGLVILFVLLRWINGYGDPAPWSAQRNMAHSLLSFLNATKQPPSLVFLSMTLGPVLILLALIEKRATRFTAFCAVYGNVPYFYVLVHLLLLRTLNVLLIIVSGVPMKSDGSPLVWQALGFGYPLWMIYLYWAFVVLALYLPCRWYGHYKRAQRHWWLSYV
ncbi:MAG: heparan-alpha-glucosaminide N-acetyltransferase domain-containing protein [Bacteroidota bacterium]|nr:heparan-alpha-glucosaminide N-acetyltransferase domain-containing protein [Bacteroidota bacterium]MDP4218433.1 heparan-alpha-glucosaminide N-acetyltransferase domain-containing protein [Bacteroidota bacterium]